MKSKLFFILFICSSCASSVHEVSVLDFEGFSKFGDGKMVDAESEQFSFWGFRFETDYVEEARDALVDKCKNGRIQGVVTKFYTNLGFFSWWNRVHMWGLCVGGES